MFFQIFCYFLLALVSKANKANNFTTREELSIVDLLLVWGLNEFHPITKAKDRGYKWPAKISLEITLTTLALG